MRLWSLDIFRKYSTECFGAFHFPKSIEYFKSSKYQYVLPYIQLVPFIFLSFNIATFIYSLMCENFTPHVQTTMVCRIQFQNLKAITSACPNMKKKEMKYLFLLSRLNFI